jgi:hypothetical protein
MTTVPPGNTIGTVGIEVKKGNCELSAGFTGGGGGGNDGSSLIISGIYLPF